MTLRSVYRGVAWRGVADVVWCGVVLRRWRQNRLLLCPKPTGGRRHNHDPLSRPATVLISQVNEEALRDPSSQMMGAVFAVTSIGLEDGPVNPGAGLAALAAQPRWRAYGNLQDCQLLSWYLHDSEGGEKSANPSQPRASRKAEHVHAGDDRGSMP